VSVLVVSPPVLLLPPEHLPLAVQVEPLGQQPPKLSLHAISPVEQVVVLPPLEPPLLPPPPEPPGLQEPPLAAEQE
jgi:hypothetical protein